MNDENEVWVIPTATPDAAPVLIEARTEGLEYEIDHQGDQFVIMTNADGAVDFKIVAAPTATPQRAHWRPSPCFPAH